MKKIKLSKGKETVVDDEDYDSLNEYSWFSNESGANPYAYRTPWIKGQNKSGSVPMHHQILGCIGEGREVDHINGNSLDNRKSNLRYVTRSQNNWNQKGQEGCSSKYKGVAWNKRRGYWEAYIQIENQKCHLGVYQSEKMAALAYDLSALCLRGEYARVNNV